MSEPIDSTFYLSDFRNDKTFLIQLEYFHLTRECVKRKTSTLGYMLGSDKDIFDYNKL